ncbi:MAG: site-2 protease family protein [Candidatus Wildermuthbacteria bacterium]|nr:site-2 protease family protein [Candidatus Wildermuthbacteria bacterium]
MMIFIAIASILFLVILHELGHFFVARKFGVKVEEFGIGLPPRLFGKKFGETLYSLNLLPLGAFVRMTGEEERSDDPRSFSKQSLFARMLIVAGGVLVFWLVAAIIFAGVGATSGIQTALDDSAVQANAKVQILGIAKGSPAEIAGLQAGDTILNFTRIGEFQESADSFKGREMSVKIQRGNESFDATLIPRENPPSGEGPLGVMLARTASITYPWYEAPFQGVSIAWNMTLEVVQGLWHTASSLFQRQGLPDGVQLTGPVGIVFLLKNTLSLGISSFLFFLGVLSVYLAVFNVLPIPAADGGRLLFLALEAVRKKPLSQALEQKIIGVSFGVLILLLLYVTVRDVSNLF